MIGEFPTGAGSKKHTKLSVPFVLSSPERRLSAAFALICVLWCCWYPVRNLILYTAIPDSASAALYSKGLSGQWKGLTEHPQLIPVLVSLGVKDAGELKNDKGFYQTLFWLTGKHTVLGINAEPGDDVGDISVFGASYVGWKAKIMELMWLVRYVPGLGKLDKTVSGTRYMRFRHSKTMRKLGLVLSLDIVEGHLLAVLSRDPDAVTELSSRVKHGAGRSIVFWNDRAPWRSPRPRKYPNHLWIPPATALRLTGETGFIGVCTEIDVGSFRKRNLSARAFLPWMFDGLRGPSASPAGLPQIESDSVFARIAFSGDFFSSVSGGLVAQDFGDSVLYLAGKPDEARLMGIALPQALLITPSNTREDAENTMMNLLKTAAGEETSGNSLFTAYRNADADYCRIMNIKDRMASGMIQPQDRPFIARKGNTVLVGSSLSSGMKLYREIKPDVVRQIPETCADAEIDFVRAAPELMNLSAAIQLASRVSGSKSMRAASKTAQTAGTAVKALSDLGRVRISCMRPRDGRVEIKAETGL